MPESRISICFLSLLSSLIRPTVSVKEVLLLKLLFSFFLLLLLLCYILGRLMLTEAINFYIFGFLQPAWVCCCPRACAGCTKPARTQGTLLTPLGMEPRSLLQSCGVTREGQSFWAFAAHSDIGV